LDGVPESEPAGDIAGGTRGFVTWQGWDPLVRRC